MTVARTDKRHFMSFEPYFRIAIDLPFTTFSYRAGTLLQISDLQSSPLMTLPGGSEDELIELGVSVISSLSSATGPWRRSVSAVVAQPIPCRPWDRSDLRSTPPTDPI